MDFTETMDFKAAVDFLEQRSGLGSVMGLDSIRNLLWELSDPQQDLKFVHIAGTNGKGSVSACLSSILKEAGCRTGTYTSPAVISVLERFQVDGAWITEREFAALAGQVKAAAERMEERGRGKPTVFEIETAMAFLYFKEKGCDIVVLETGLGGEQDATNVVEHTLAAVFTSISMDHMGMLGNTLGEIAACKAGIMKPGCQVVSAPQAPEVVRVLKERAAQMGCSFAQVDGGCLDAGTKQRQDRPRSYPGENVFSYKGMKGIRISLPGTYQMENGALALETALALTKKGIAISESDIRRGLSNVSWPGRFQMIKASPAVIVDGAHNRDAALRLRECVQTCLKGKRLIFIMGVFMDKEYALIVQTMAPLAEQIYTVWLPDRSRSLPPEVLAEEAGKYCGRTQAADSVGTALDMALEQAGREGVVLAFGSLSYLGQVMEEAERRRRDDRQE
ncbi:MULTISPECIES: folylpolyglutamate synthase/dihydrofolate synthase family protein [unclassified Clostridium]|uniref:bifunctional folylpolyglutamate synthase/dihydrofolate synthase n=1 Tax=unclassified Clostridium TaxID=2614128 RepID=UPI001FAAEBF2|nr:MULTISPECIES: folylpolyglutamate synthase/dihydrofolate synthase family protein [unclassified Clostridium]